MCWGEGEMSDESERTGGEARTRLILVFIYIWEISTIPHSAFRISNSLFTVCRRVSTSTTPSINK